MIHFTSLYKFTVPTVYIINNSKQIFKDQVKQFCTISAITLVCMFGRILLPEALDNRKYPTNTFLGLEICKKAEKRLSLHELADGVQQLKK